MATGDSEAQKSALYREHMLALKSHMRWAWTYIAARVSQVIWFLWGFWEAEFDGHPESWEFALGWLIGLAILSILARFIYRMFKRSETQWRESVRRLP